MIDIYSVPGFTQPFSSISFFLGAIFFTYLSYFLIRRGKEVTYSHCLADCIFQFLHIFISDQCCLSFARDKWNSTYGFSTTRPRGYFSGHRGNVYANTVYSFYRSSKMGISHYPLGSGHQWSCP